MTRFALAALLLSSCGSALADTVADADEAQPERSCLRFAPTDGPGVTEADWTDAIDGDGALDFWIGDTERASVTGDGFLRLPLDPTPQGRAPTLKYDAGVLIPEARTVTLTQTLVFGGDEAVWARGRELHGGKVGFGLYGRSATGPRDAAHYPDGGDEEADGFSARIMFRGPSVSGGSSSSDPDSPGGDHLAVYAYHALRTQNRPWGDDFAMDFEPVPGVPFEVAMEVRANSGPGIPDGHVRVWIDGEPMLDRQGLAWTTEGPRGAMIDRVSFASFYGGSGAAWSPVGPSVLAVGDVC